MKRLLSFIKPYRRWVIIAPLCMVVEVCCDLLQPTLMSTIIDNGVATGDMGYILRTCLLMVGCAFLGSLGGAGNMYFSVKASYGFARDLRSAVYRKIQSFSFANIDKFSTGSLVTRTTNDVTQVQNAFTQVLGMLVRSPLLCIGGVAAVLMLNARLSLIVLCTIPVLAVIIVILFKLTNPLFMQVQKKLDKVNVVMQENLAGIRVIKAFGRSAHEKQRFGQANDELTGINTKAMRNMSIAFPVVGLVMNVAMILMYWFGGRMVFAGNMQAGEIMAFTNYITQILMSLTMSSFALMFLSRATVSMQRVNEVLDTEPDILSGDDERAYVKQGRVEFRDVSFSYPGQSGDPVLQHISFTAEPGETVAILGATGAGKSTLISLIPRLYDATGGEVLVDGVDVRQYNLKKLRSGIGVALQKSVLFTGAIADNLRWSDASAPSRLVEQAAEIAQAQPFIDESPDGYATMLGQGGVNLSGGQKQRLSIARALVKHPAILILDDSTSAVDLATEAEIQRGLREVMGHMTVFIIAQRISSVMDADKIIVMENGRIADIGKHAELKQRCDIYREIVVSQLGKEALD